MYIIQIKFPVVTIYTVDRNKRFLSCTHMTTYMRKALETLWKTISFCVQILYKTKCMFKC